MAGKRRKDWCTEKSSKWLEIQNPQQQCDSECVTSPIEPLDREKVMFLFKQLGGFAFEIEFSAVGLSTPRVGRVKQAAYPD